MHNMYYTLFPFSKRITRKFLNNHYKIIVYIFTMKMLTLKDYNNLPVEEKVDYVKKIYEIFKEEWESWLLGSLALLVEELNAGDFSEDFLNSLYKLVYDVLEIKKSIDKTKDHEKLQKIRQKLQQLRIKEEEEKDNPDDILKQLD